MKKNMMLAALIGVTGLLSAGALAGYVAWKNPAFAEVVSVEPVRQFVAASDSACVDEQVSRHEAAANEALASAVAINGMAGGMITRQPARLEKVATLRAVATSGAHCRKADRVSEKIVAYDVRYRLHGKTTKVRMDHDPGARLPVRDGKVVIMQDSGRNHPKV